MRYFNYLFAATVLISAVGGAENRLKTCDFSTLIRATRLAKKDVKALPQYLIPEGDIPFTSIPEKDLENTFFTADSHFDHAGILRTAERPFSDVREMNEMMILEWNRTVPYDGTVYVAGDFSMNLETVAKILPRLNGKKILIAGNHDLCHPVNQKCRSPQDFEKYRAQYLAAGFDDVELAMKVQLGNDDPFYLTHYPYMDPEGLDIENRAGLPFRLPDDGKSTLVCGHVHCQWTQSGRMLNVGVDAHGFAPVSAKTLRGKIAQNADGKSNILPGPADFSGAENALGLPPSSLSPFQKKVMQQAHEYGVGQKGRDGIHPPGILPNGKTNYTNAQLHEKLRLAQQIEPTTGKPAFTYEQAKLLVQKGYLGTGLVETQGDKTSASTHTVYGEHPQVPSSFQITTDLEKLHRTVKDAERKYSLRNGSSRPNTHEELLNAFNSKMEQLRASRPQAAAMHPTDAKIAELTVGRDALIELERRRNLIYQRFFEANPPRPFPFGFTTSDSFHAFETQFPSELRRALTQPGNKQILTYLGGSATEGLSYMDKNMGILRKPFHPDSDFDITVEVPPGTFSNLFGKGKLNQWVDGNHTYPLDAENLTKFFDSNPELKQDSPIYNLIYFLKKQSNRVGGRPITLVFTDSNDFVRSRPSNMWELGK